MKITAITILAILIVNPAISKGQVDAIIPEKGGNNVITAVPFLLIGPDARTAGMGEIGAASLPDVNAMAVNPSKIAFLESKYGVSASYSPWLNNLKAKINLGYLSGYYKLSDRNTIGGSLRYFSIGDVQLFDQNQQDLGLFTPNEFAMDFTFVRRFGDTFSLGTALRYIRSDLSSDQHANAGNALAVDASAYMRKPVMFFGKNAWLGFGVNISNIGTKMTYSDASEKLFLPTNLKLGTAITLFLDELNQLTLGLDLNKLLVPTQPIYDINGEIVRGKSPNVSVPSGIFGSFTDAPGGFSEEIKEVNIGSGIEYMYKRNLAVRCGYFYENPQKGDRRYFTVGGGFSYQYFRVDLAYLVAETQNSPLANTLRLSLTFNAESLTKENRN